MPRWRVTVRVGHTVTRHTNTVWRQHWLHWSVALRRAQTYCYRLFGRPLTRRLHIAGETEYAMAATASWQ